MGRGGGSASFAHDQLVGLAGSVLREHPNRCEPSPARAVSAVVLACEPVTCNVAEDRRRRGSGRSQTQPRGWRGVGDVSARLPDLSRGWQRAERPEHRRAASKTSMKPGAISRAGDGNRTRMTSLEGPRTARRWTSWTSEDSDQEIFEPTDNGGRRWTTGSAGCTRDRPSLERSTCSIPSPMALHDGGVPVQHFDDAVCDSGPTATDTPDRSAAVSRGVAVFQRRAPFDVRYGCAAAVVAVGDAH